MQHSFGGEGGRGCHFSNRIAVLGVGTNVPCFAKTDESLAVFKYDLQRICQISVNPHTWKVYVVFITQVIAFLW